VFAVAPFAHADPDSGAPSGTGSAPGGAAPSPASSAGSHGAAKVGKAAPQPKAGKTKQAVAPNFGTQKIRVGVQVKSGAFVPPGTTTAGTSVSIVETGPNAELAAAVYPDACQTVAGSEPPGSTETFCDFGRIGNMAAAKRALARAGVSIPTPSDPVAVVDYLAFPGDTVTFTQTTVNANLLIDSVPQTIGPCVNPVPTAPVSNGAAPDAFAACSDSSLDVTFNDPGLPPVAKDDSASLVSGTSADIDVLGNDTTHGAPVTITQVGTPSHGTAKLVNPPAAGARTNARTLAASGTPVILYTPKAGFVGHDSFRYTITTANGSSTATVRVTVVAPPPTANDDSAITTSGNPVTIDITANDNANGGGALSIKAVGDPSNGTVTINGDQVVYTSNSDFVGTDHFTYTISTAFGTGTATVTVTVNGALAVTGTPDQAMVDLSILLLIVGGGAVVAGRRRYHGRHV
jgi:hypothetical protein